MNLAPFVEIAKKIESFKTYKELVNFVDSLYGTDDFDRLIMYAKAMYLFTTGNVASIRDASLYNKELAEFDDTRVPILVHLLGNYDEGREEFFLGKPSRFDYRASGQILSALSNMKGILPFEVNEVYRGLSRLKPEVYLGLCKPEQVYNIGNISSTSISFNIAEGFSNRTPRWNLVYILSNKDAQKGVYTGNFTSGYEKEKEVIISGDIRVTGFKWEPFWGILNPDSGYGYFNNDLPWEITDFEQLIYYVNVFEKHISMDGALTGQTIVYGEII